MLKALDYQPGLEGEDEGESEHDQTGKGFECDHPFAGEFFGVNLNGH